MKIENRIKKGIKPLGFKVTSCKMMNRKNQLVATIHLNKPEYSDIKSIYTNEKGLTKGTTTLKNGAKVKVVYDKRVEAWLYNQAA